MTSLAHDGAASLRVEYLSGAPGRKEGVERMLAVLDIDARSHQ